MSAAIPDPMHPRPVRFSEAQWEDVRRAADAEGVTASEFVRRAALASAGDVLADVVYVRLNGGGVVQARIVGEREGRRVFDDGGPLLVEGVDCEVVEDNRP